MGTIFIYIIGLTIIEIYLFISIGSEIGAFTTILLIFLTAITGVYYARYEGLKTLKAGFTQLSKNEPPSYEILSGAGIAFAALLLIIPGFLTDLMGFLLILYEIFEDIKIHSLNNIMPTKGDITRGNKNII